PCDVMQQGRGCFGGHDSTPRGPGPARRAAWSSAAVAGQVAGDQPTCLCPDFTGTRSPLSSLTVFWIFWISWMASREEPRANVVSDGLQSLVGNRLPIGTAHARDFMSHREITGRLVLRLVSHGSENVAQAVEPQALPPVDTQLLEQLTELPAEWSVRRAGVP